MAKGNRLWLVDGLRTTAEELCDLALEAGGYAGDDPDQAANVLRDWEYVVEE